MESLVQVESTNNTQSVPKILKSYDIVDVISKVSVLKKVGEKYIGQCPFHGERMPFGDAMSLQVDPEKQIFKCLRCGLSGNHRTFTRLLGY